VLKGLDINKHKEDKVVVIKEGQAEGSRFQGNYVQASFDELRRVTWPSHETVIRATLFIVLIVVISTLYVGGLDFVFNKLILKLRVL
jgi:preprotein translocase SecE subunit